MSVGQCLQAGEQDQRHQRRPFPGVDRDQGGERALRVGEQPARTAEAEFRQGIAEHAIFRTEQRLEDEPDHQRRDCGGNKQKPERDAIEPIVTPQKQRNAKAEDEFERDRAEGEGESVDQCAARRRIAPQAEIIVEADEMPRGRADQVVIVERVEKPLDHRPDSDGEHVDERRRSHRCEKHLTLADIGPAGRERGVIVGRGASARSNGHVALISGGRRTPSPSGRRWPQRASGRTPVLPDGLWGPDEGLAHSPIIRTWEAWNEGPSPTAETLIRRASPDTFSPREKEERRLFRRFSGSGNPSGPLSRHHLNKACALP